MDIMSLTAVELGKKIKAKEISVTEATQAYLDQIEKVENVFREDIVTNGDGSKETLSNAPLEKDQSFKVPKTIG